jgi:protein-tyrosine phosphatase
MVQGDPMDRWTLAMLGKLGVDGRGHRARQLARPLIERAELILAMSLDQRSWIAAEVPQALPRTFTLREFARLAVAVRGFQSQSVAEMIGRAAANRAVYPVAPGGSDEIRDPAGGTLDDFRAAVEAVRQCSVQIARELNGHDRLRGVVAPVRRSVRLAF